MKTRDFTAVYVKSGRMVAAWLEELPGVNTQGRTLVEAKKNLKEALILFLEENRKLSAIKSYNSHKETLSVPASV